MLDSLSLDRILGFLVRWPLIDILLGMFMIVSVIASWRRGPAVRSQEPDPNERQLGITVLHGQLNGTITTSSIILAGIGAVLGFSTGVIANPLVRWSIFWSAVHAVIALCSAVYTMATLPARAPTENALKSQPVAVASAIALFFALAAALRFLTGVGIAVFAIP